MKKILDKRLDNRVDDMIKKGLVQELTKFHTRYNEQRLEDNTPPDYTKGIFQSIGFKEFHEYLILDAKERENDNGIQLLETAIINLKLVTRRFARKQIKWVSNRFLGRPDRQVPFVYGLDTSDISKWKENVENPAIEIITNFMDFRESIHKPLDVKCPLEATTPCSEEETYYCDICERIFVGLHQWTDHKNSRKHKKVVQRKNKNHEDIKSSSVDNISARTEDASKK